LLQLQDLYSSLAVLHLMMRYASRAIKEPALLPFREAELQPVDLHPPQSLKVRRLPQSVASWNQKEWRQKRGAPV
jgi:hypothetical protein